MSLAELAKKEVEKQREREQQLKDSLKEEVITPKEDNTPIDLNDLRITSDEFRTSTFLIMKKSSRKKIPEIFQELRELFNTHNLIKKGKFYYFVKK